MIILDNKIINEINYIYIIYQLISIPAEIKLQNLQILIYIKSININSGRDRTITKFTKIIFI